MRASTILCVALAVAAIGCKKKKEEADPPPIPVDSAPAPVAVASEAPPPEASPVPSGSAPVGEVAAPPPAAPQPGSQATAKKESIDDCCSALRAYRSSGRPKAIKDKAANAARVCSAVAPVVRDGRSSRQAALTQVRAALQGAEGPPECR